MHKIAVISDTHGLLRPEIVEKIKDCEQILHAGDIDKQEIIDRLKEMAPLCAVRGNADRDWAKEKDGIFYLNPGSCGPRRFHQAITMAILTIYEEEHRFEVENIDVSPILDAGKKQKVSRKDLHYVIHRIIKEMNAGKSIDSIAKKNRVDKDLVEQICRIYATHPGVDTDGILNRLELRNIYNETGR